MFSDVIYIYFLGEILEIEITSPQTCGQTDTRDVVSTIVLQCDPDGKLVSYIVCQGCVSLTPATPRTSPK